MFWKKKTGRHTVYGENTQPLSARSKLFTNKVKKIKNNRSDECLKGSTRTTTSTIPENEEEVEELSLSHDEPGCHLSIRQIAPQLIIRKSSVHTIIKTTKINAFKRVLTTQINEVCRKKTLVTIVEYFGKIFSRFSFKTSF